jgi:hypothetical protein
MQVQVNERSSKASEKRQAKKIMFLRNIIASESKNGGLKFSNHPDVIQILNEQKHSKQSSRK